MEGVIQTGAGLISSYLEDPLMNVAAALAAAAFWAFVNDSSSVC